MYLFIAVMSFAQAEKHIKAHLGLFFLEGGGQTFAGFASLDNVHLI